jgi:hydroxypyruvate isomerase
MNLPMPFQLSPNIELLFTEAGSDPADRVRAAKAAGFQAVEMWGTLEKDVPALAKACADAGISVTSVLAEPRTNFTFPWTDLAEFWDGLDRGIEDARTLGSPRIVLGSGMGFPGMKRQQNLDKLTQVFRDVVERYRGSGVGFVLEPVNTRVDHPGALLDRTGEAVAVARGVGDPSFGILYDLYHSVTEGEDVEAVLDDAGDLVHYVQVADSPGRGEPGSGSIDWSEALVRLGRAGYSGPLGLEYFPTTETLASLRRISELVAG